MIINIIGCCDKRPVLYTVMKMLQSLGDVLLVSSSTRLARLSETGESGGSYQNIMVGITTEGLDDFFEEFPYDIDDFANVIVDNLVTADADLTIYVKGLIQNQTDTDMLEYIDDYQVIEPYALKDSQGSMFYNCEKFEAYRNLNPISQKLALAVGNILAPLYKTTGENLMKIAMAEPKGSNPGAAPQKKDVPKPPTPAPEEGSKPVQQKKKKGLFGR